MKKYYHPACEDCVMNYNCLLQSTGDVEDCYDVQQWEREDEQPTN